jgi:hypothetical protein
MPLFSGEIFSIISIYGDTKDCSCSVGSHALVAMNLVLNGFEFGFKWF